MKLLKKLFPSSWNINDVLVIYGVVRCPGAADKGFVYIPNVRNRMWQKGFLTIESRAKKVFGDDSGCVHSCEYAGTQPIPTKDGKYLFVYAEIDQLLRRCVAFDLISDMNIPQFGPVRNQFIRADLIKRNVIEFPDLRQVS